MGRFAVTGIPGYAGYVPGKYPENVLGATHQRTNELSIAACDARAFPEETGAKYNPGGLRTRDGYNVPGYTGFVPGKYADNVHGHVFGRVNQISKVIKGEQAIDRAKWRVPRYGHPDWVLGHSGLFRVYAGTRHWSPLSVAVHARAALRFPPVCVDFAVARSPSRLRRVPSGARRR